MQQTAALLDQFGAEPAVAAAVDVFYGRVLGDPMLAPFFDHTGVYPLKGHQRALLTFALRGTGAYNGRTMRAAHAGLGISDAHFDRVAMHLAETLAALGVPAALIDQVIGGVAALRAEIVDDTAIAPAA